MQGPKYTAGKSIEFLGLRCDFPQVESGMLLRIYLPEEEITKWATLVGEIVELWTTQPQILREADREIIVFPDFGHGPFWVVGDHTFIYMG